MTLWRQLAFLLVVAGASLVLLLWVAIMLSYHERTKDKLFWWVAFLSLIAYSYVVHVGSAFWR